MAAENRPLSPHLQVYRPQLTSILSVTHRATGVANAVGLVVLVYWLTAIAAGPEAYAAASAVLGSWPVQLLLFGWTWTFFYHLCNGIRHLAWDMGKGFEISQVYASGWVVVGVSLSLTLIAWFLFVTGGAS